MKNACLYLLVIITAAYTTGLCELAKLPAFISHYKEHRANASAAGLGEFIAMHYFGQDKKDNDQHKDDALPFRSGHHSKQPVYTHVAASYPVTFTFKYTVIKKATPYFSTFLPNGVALACFRPPCTAFC